MNGPWINSTYRVALKIAAWGVHSLPRASSTTSGNRATFSTSTCSPTTAPCPPTRSSWAPVQIFSGKNFAGCSHHGNSHFTANPWYSEDLNKGHLNKGNQILAKRGPASRFVIEANHKCNINKNTINHLNTNLCNLSRIVGEAKKWWFAVEVFDLEANTIEANSE